MIAHFQIDKIVLTNQKRKRRITKQDIHNFS
jgi:hypothetical protein